METGRITHPNDQGRGTRILILAVGLCVVSGAGALWWLNRSSYDECLIKEMRGQRWARLHGSVLLGASRGGMGDKINKNDADHLLDPARYIANCEPLGGGFKMEGPEDDPFPYKEWDPMNDSEVQPSEEGLWFTR